MKKLYLILVCLLFAFSSYAATTFTAKEKLAAAKLNTAFSEKHDVVAFQSYSTATQAKLNSKLPATNPVVSGTISTDATDGQHYILPYNSVAFSGNPSVGMIQSTPTGVQWYNGSAWVAIGSGDGGTWGNITGTLASQTDLQNALNAKASTSYVDSAIAGVGASTIPSVSSDPAAPADGSAWYNTTDHTLNVSQSTGWTKFSGTFTAWDTTPTAFTFTDQTDVAVNSTITSAAITVSGINHAAPISITGGTYDINASGTFVSAAGTVNNGDTVRARHTSSASNSTATNTVVTIGGVSDTFTSTTAAGVTLTYEETGTTEGFNTAYSWVGGRYNPTGTEQIVKVQVYVTSKTGSPTANMYARIYPLGTITGNFNTALQSVGSPLGKSVAVASSGITVPGWVEFTFSSPVSITNSTNGYGIAFGPDTPDYSHYFAYGKSATTTNGDGYFMDRWSATDGTYVTGVDANISMRVYKQ